MQQDEDTYKWTLPRLEEDGIDHVLYKGASAPKIYTRQPPSWDFQLEYKTTGSYREARRKIETLSQGFQEQQRRKHEAFQRQVAADKFRTEFVETRLATCDVPTLNTRSVTIERQRRQGIKAELRPNKSNWKLGQRIDKAQKDRERQILIRNGIRRAYGSQTLDLSALELTKIPQQVYSTLLLQLGRFIRIVNVSRNELRELPKEFLLSFMDVRDLLAKENSLSILPDGVLHRLDKLQVLDVSCNQLHELPPLLPDSLCRLIANRNRIHQIRSIHWLAKVEELDLGYNQFQTLPRGLLYLTKLRKITFSSNRVISLALLPRASGTTRRHAVQSVINEHELENDHKAWRMETDPVNGTVIYYNSVTKEITRCRPACLEDTIEAELHLPGSPNTEVNHKSNASNANALDWDIVLKDDNGNGLLKYIRHHPYEEYDHIPPELDRWERFQVLRAIHMSNNQLSYLPSSIGKLARLKCLELENNCLVELPETLDGLEALQILELANNSLRSLPPSICKLKNLQTLDLKLNRLGSLPDNFGELIRLENLDVSSNYLKMLPESFLELTKLMKVCIRSNPGLVSVAGFHPATLVSGNLPEIRWQLQHRLEIIRRGGMAPTVESQAIGVSSHGQTDVKKNVDSWSTNIHIHKEILKAVNAAKSTHLFSFHWKNLYFDQLPASFFTEISHLQEIKLSGQNFKSIPATFGCFPKLRVLQLRQNCIKSIDEDVFIGLPLLEELDIVQNRIESLPESIGSLLKLKRLIARNNMLDRLPNSLIKLSKCLVELGLAHNRFKTAPSCLYSLSALKILDISYNQLSSVDDVNWAHLTELEELFLNTNALVSLPPSIGSTHLRVIEVCGNALETLPEPILLLQDSLEILKVQSNKISRLPRELGDLYKLQLFASDGNPFRWPPPEIIKLDIECIRQYFYKRQQRVEEMLSIFATLGLQADLSVFSAAQIENLIVGSVSKVPVDPYAHPDQLLSFLTSNDLKEFEEAVDEYVNGHFYFASATTRGVDLVYEYLLQRHYSHSQEQRGHIVRDLVQLCELIRRKRWLDKIDFCFDATRPWGRRGEDVPVYIIDPVSLYEPIGKVPSILQVISTRAYHGFVGEEFPHAREVVEDALTHYIGVYGRVGCHHDAVPFHCGCEGFHKLQKMHDPCRKPGWIIVQHILTSEEVSRRETDESTIETAVQQLRPQVETFLATKEGRKRFQSEVKVIKKRLKQEVKDYKKKLKKAKRKHKKKAKSYNAVLLAEKKKAKVNRSPVKLSFEQAKKREAERMVVERRADRVKRLVGKIEQRKKQLSQNLQAFHEDIVTILLGTVGTSVRRHLINQQRDKAIENEWRRPWDLGFRTYKHEMKRRRMEELELEYMDESPEEGESSNSELSDVSFDGYDDLACNASEYDEEEDSEEEEEEEQTNAK